MEELAKATKGQENGLTNGKKKRTLVWATDGCDFGAVTFGEDEDVEGEVKKCLAERKEDLESKMEAWKIIQNGGQRHL